MTESAEPLQQGKAGAAVPLWGGCLATHLLLTHLAPSPWWVPDLTTAGLVMALSLSSARWAWLAVGSALWTAVWTVRLAGPVSVGYLGIGWVLQRLGHLWDLTDPRLQALLTVLASGVISYEWLWVDGHGTPALFGLLTVRALLTGGATWLIRMGFRRWGRGASGDHPSTDR